MVYLGLKPGAAGSKAHTNPLRYCGTQITQHFYTTWNGHGGHLVMTHPVQS